MSAVTRRIKTDQPSSEKPLLLFIPSSVNSGFVNTSWTTLVEAPDFSIPSLGDDGFIEDPDEQDRELRPGLVFIETPLTVVNETGTPRWVQLRILLQGSSGQAISLTPQVFVPAGEAIYLPIQGTRLLKTDLSGTLAAPIPGGRLQVRGETANSLTVFGSASESEAPDHAPDTEDEA